MEALEKAKLALRAHLLANKEKVAADLAAMRSKSGGNDIFNYVEGLSNAYNLGAVSVTNEVSFEALITEVEFYKVELGWNVEAHYSPPTVATKELIEKDLERKSGSFFCNIVV